MVKELVKNMLPDWFRTLHPFIQALGMICCSGLIAILLINHDATTNLVSILTLLLYFFSKHPKDPK